MSTTPLYLQANGLYNIFSGRKKWTITCGRCQHTWIEKVPIVDRCSAICPNCREQNVWSLQAWARHYDADLAERKAAPRKQEG